jgi:flagellar FliL protein
MRPSNAAVSVFSLVKKLRKSPVMKFRKIISAFIVILATSGLALTAGKTDAAESGGAGASYVKIPPFTVNLQDAEKFLQTSFSIKGGSPEVTSTVNTYMPAVRHELILLLSSQKSVDIMTVSGKMKLLESLKAAINKAIGMDGKTGVIEVVFESFIVQ